MIKKVIFFVLIALVGYGLSVKAQVKIPANDPNIVFRGVLYPILSADSVILNRYSEDFFTKTTGYFDSVKGRTQSGVVISFKTSSPTIIAIFKQRLDAEQRQLYFSVYRNSVFTGYFTGLQINMTSTSITPTTWDIVLPPWAGVHFCGLYLQNNYSLLPVEPETKKNYIAIGNSITHGTGQTNVSSDGTYPYILASDMNWRLYNMAVGGSRITPLIADQTSVIKADVITVLWGFNDWNLSKAIIADVIPAYKSMFIKLRYYHPDAEIYAIMPTVTKATSPAYYSNGILQTYSIDTLRNSERRTVQQLIDAGDKRLFIIEGQNLTTTTDLSDIVHFNNTGAVRFGHTLATIVKQNELSLNGIESVENPNNLKNEISVSGQVLRLSNVKPGDKIWIYDMRGVLIAEKISHSTEERFELCMKGGVVVRINRHSIKAFIYW